MIHKRHKHDIIIILALIAFGISMYLTVSKAIGAVVPCDITGGCEDVLNSRYSTFLGLPLALWGVGYFSAVIIAGLLANHYVLWRRLLTWLLGLGSLASLVFLGLQFFVIKKICQYCLATDILTIVMFVWDLNIEHRGSHKD